jgi:hypothetical protein
MNREQEKVMFDTLKDFVEHTHCHYFNYSENPDFVASDFYDADHLNEIGAEKMSRKLARDIDSLSRL